MKVLIIDDEASIRETTRVAVETAGHAGLEAPNSARALKALEDDGVDAAFLDVKLGAEDGIDVLSRLLKGRPGLPVVVFTAFADVATAVEAMRRGAFDFIPKPFTPDQVRAVLAKIERNRALQQRVSSLETDLAGAQPPADLDSAEPALQRAMEMAFKAAATPSTILLLGPSGTGKSVLAREIHRRSPQREAAFVTVSCPSLSRELLESELFGHSRGAFTGAVQDAAGKVAAADGGTLFLDEIGELPAEVQPRLLRLLQEREYERVGETRPRRANVRVIAATNRDLGAEVRAGRFRQDLFYRLNVVSIALAPLRERRTDIARLAEANLRFFSRRLGKRLPALSPEAAEAFARYAWPGNLREMSNVLERAVILARGPVIGLDDLPEEFSTPANPAVAVGARVSLEILEGEHIRRLIESCSSLEETARTLGIDPATLYRKRQKLGLR